MNRVLVTGGEGFLGAHLAQRLGADGHEVHIVSRPNPGRRWKLLDLLAAEARVHAVDLLDHHGLAAAVAAIQPERVFHLAARVDLERSSEMARLCIGENITATVNLLDALQRSDVASVVFTSTTEVYGAGPVPFREEQALDPPSPYSVSKIAGESFCRLWAGTFHCPVRIVRLAAGYGPGQRIERLIPTVIMSALRKEPLTLRSPDHRRDYLFATDAIDAIVRAADVPLPAGATLNIGSTDVVAIREIASQILTALNCADLPVTYGSGRINEPPCLATDASKARAQLNWQPEVSLEEGLERTIAWYRALFERGTLR